MARRPYERSIPEIVADLFEQFPTLVRKEANLARVEISEKLASMGRGVGVIAAGAILLIPALVVLLGAGVAALERGGIAPSVAALIVGGSTLVVGVVLLLIGINKMKISNLVPEKTIHQLQRDASVARHQVSAERSAEDVHQRAA